MTDDEIVKALEQILRACFKRGTFYDVIKNALSLINRQKAEIESLQRRNNECCTVIERLREGKFSLSEGLETARAEAIKEFAERVKRYIDVGHLRPPTEICFSELDVVSMIDNLVKEMVGDTG